MRARPPATISLLQPRTSSSARHAGHAWSTPRMPTGESAALRHPPEMPANILAESSGKPVLKKCLHVHRGSPLHAIFHIAVNKIYIYNKQLFIKTRENMKHIAAAAALFFALADTHAQMTSPAPSPVRFLIGMGLSAGGDELASAHYTNGDNVNIHAGGLIYFTAGVDYHFTPEFSLQGTVNYHVDRANAKNGNVKFERIPVELLGYYQPAPQWRVGGGVRYTSSPKLTGSGAGAGLDADFDGTTSAVIEAEYFTSPNLGFKLRYVNETFKSNYTRNIDGSHVGVSLNYYF